MKLAEMARKSGLASAVDFEFSEIVPWRRAREMLKGQEQGKLLHFEVHWQLQTYANKNGLHNWKTDASQGGGTLGNFVSHVFFYLEWLLGPMRSLLCKTSDQDRLVTLLVELESGQSGLIRVGANTPHCFRHQVELFCENGILLLENLGEDYVKDFRLTLQRGNSRQLLSTDAEAQTFSDGRIAAVNRLARRFLEQVSAGHGMKNEKVPDLAAGARVELLLEKAGAANASGRWEGC
jgi:predicted dehydrogenase